MIEETAYLVEVAETVGGSPDVANASIRSVLESVSTQAVDGTGAGGGDWLHEVRLRNRARLKEKTAEILAFVDGARIREPSPTLAIPLLRAAQDESREALQSMWATLLANAMVDDGGCVRRDYIDAARHFEPVDALVLDLIDRLSRALYRNEMRVETDGGFLSSECERLSLPLDDLAVALTRLIKLGCVTVQNEKSRVLLGESPTLGDDFPRITPFGRAMLAACRPPRPSSGSDYFQPTQSQ